MLSRTASHEFILQHFRACRGLYILGAGASTGLVPFASEFLRIPAIDQVRGGSFPADTSAQSELTVNSTSALLSAENISSLVYPDRSKRPGTEDPPYAEILRRQTDYFTRRRLEVALATPRFRQLKSDSYLVFRKFYPSVILNYNLDGLASDLCTPPHEVIAAHGTVDRGYGSPEMEEFLRSVREFDRLVPRDDNVLCVRESDDPFGGQLQRKLSRAMGACPHFIAVIGYSFGPDDWVSWLTFCRAFRRFAGIIYVIGPEPQELSNRIADAIKSKSVFGIRAYWNILAHAFIDAIGDYRTRRSLNYTCERILDASGDRTVFLRDRL